MSIRAKKWHFRVQSRVKTNEVGEVNFAEIRGTEEDVPRKLPGRFAALQANACRFCSTI